jgi:hypothetical protein
MKSIPKCVRTRLYRNVIVLKHTCENLFQNAASRSTAGLAQTQRISEEQTTISGFSRGASSHELHVLCISLHGYAVSMQNILIAINLFIVLLFPRE